MKGSYQK